MTADEFSDLLRAASPFYYCPNFGNLGDLLIAEGTRRFLDSCGIDYCEWPENGTPAAPYNIVYAGGARFTANWCTAEAVESLLSPQVGQCIILPHSLNGVDDMLHRMGENCHIICREEPSYTYCLKSGTRAKVYLAGDMAFNLNLDALTPASLNLPQSELNEEERRTCRLLQNGMARRLAQGVRRASVQATAGGRTRRVAFLLRGDSERAFAAVSPLTYDISVAWHTSGRAMRYNANMLLAFRDALRCADVVVTDRLHVAVMCYKAGVEVYMLDNSYRKLSGVYRQSMAGNPLVHLLDSGMTPELQEAWHRLNAPHRLLVARMGKLCRAVSAGCTGLLRRAKGKCVYEYRRLFLKK